MKEEEIKKLMVKSITIAYEIVEESKPANFYVKTDFKAVMAAVLARTIFKNLKEGDL